MFRSLFRRPRKVAIPREDSGTIGFQRVKVSEKPRNSITRTIANVVVLYCAYRTVVLLVYGPSPELKKRWDEAKKDTLKDYEKRQQALKDKSKPSEVLAQQRHGAFAKAKGFGKQAAEKEDLAEKDGDSTILMTIPGWIKELDPKPIKPDDPEMKAFETLKQDDKAIKKLMQIFDDGISQQVANNRRHQAAIRIIGFKAQVGRDLNFQPMFFHPPRYAMRCIVGTTTGTIKLKWTELDPEQGARLQKMLHPVVMSQAFFAGIWAFTTTSAALATAKVMDLLYPARTYKLKTEYGKIGKWLVIKNQQFGYSLGYEDKVITKLPSQRWNNEQAEKNLPFLKARALNHAIDMFKRKWIQGQLKSQRHTAAGAVNIVGFYDFIGDKGRYRVEVFGTYVPGDNVMIGPPQITGGKILADMSSRSKPQSRTLPSVMKSPEDMNIPHDSSLAPAIAAPTENSDQVSATVARQGEEKSHSADEPEQLAAKAVIEGMRGIAPTGELPAPEVMRADLVEARTAMKESHKALKALIESVQDGHEAPPPELRAKVAADKALNKILADKTAASIARPGLPPAHKQILEEMRDQLGADRAVLEQAEQRLNELAAATAKPKEKSNYVDPQAGTHAASIQNMKALAAKVQDRSLPTDARYAAAQALAKQTAEHLAAQTATIKAKGAAIGPAEEGLEPPSPQLRNALAEYRESHRKQVAKSGTTAGQAFVDMFGPIPPDQPECKAGLQAMSDDIAEKFAVQMEEVERAERKIAEYDANVRQTRQENQAEQKPGHVDAQIAAATLKSRGTPHAYDARLAAELAKTRVENDMIAEMTKEIKALSARLESEPGSPPQRARDALARLKAQGKSALEGLTYKPPSHTPFMNLKIPIMPGG
ncbi:uncharacterized protein AB675_2406 [Cyphellophora attinorum]|uniref:Uncharacterized protein n=1 Tax=Cyphellophora attinorum TaxID=1664694 RepID=A0A0N1HGI4_9EURO|nr:uncharacterized protein AB675_2406 [Phialophora attinorum]KPI45305.1 hypothetical protein AB675_2406 [Phialophora attinorum]